MAHANMRMPPDFRAGQFGIELWIVGSGLAQGGGGLRQGLGPLGQRLLRRLARVRADRLVNQVL